MTNTTYGEVQVANEYLDDPTQLETVFQRDGYLFFRGVIDVSEILQVKHDLIQLFQAQGVVKTGEAEPIWTGAELDKVDDVPNLRYTLPDHSMYVTPAHQDFFFIQGTSFFRTLWIPLMDIDDEVGGLAVAAGSHKGGLREHAEQEGVYSYVFKGRRQKGVKLEDIHNPWLTTDYHAGDVLIFHNLTLHWGLPNHSNRIRLSMDTRAQPAAAPRTLQIEKSILELREYRREVQRIATEEGADEAFFEVVLIEMMKRGLKPERDSIKTVMSQLDRQTT